MVQVYINYNPYKVETEFRINDKQVSKKSKLSFQSKNRLQYWLEKNNANWNGIVKELMKETNQNDFDITFVGRKIDFDDLKLTFENSEENIKFKFKHIETKNEKDILKDIGKIIDEVENGPIKELKDKGIREAYNKAKSSEFNISVIATMSSGKSTLLNSFIGYDLLPSKNEACTATIAKIKDNDDLDKFYVECFDNKGKKIVDRKEAKLSDLEEYNEDEKVVEIKLEGPIPNISSEKMNLVITDTPGPNNSRNADHGEVTNRIINDENKGVVLYVINATQFGINDDYNLLSNIASVMKRGGKQSKDRFIFAINKCDEFDCEKKESIGNLLEKVREYLGNHGIEDPNLFPVSAQIAKLIRKNQNGCELTKKEKRKLKEYEDFIDMEGYYFDEMASLSESCRESLRRKLKEAQDNEDEYTEALIHTGIPAIEETINEYLEKYAYPIKIKDAISELQGIIETKVAFLDLDKKIAKDEKQFKKVREQIKQVKEKLRKGDIAKSFEEIVESIEIYDGMFESIANKINNKFADIADKYEDKDKIEEDTAKYEIKNFKNTIDRLQVQIEGDLNRIIEDSIFDQGEKIIEEYRMSIKELNEDLEIDGFSFEKINGINKVNLKDVDKLIKRFSETEDIYETEIRKNEQKKWYKPWTWGQDDYIEVEVKVGEKKYINVSKVIQESLGKIRNGFTSNIEYSKEETQRRIDMLKEYFNGEISKLDEVMKNIINDLELKTRDFAEVKSRVNKNKEICNWIDNISNKIENIMS